MVWTRIFLITGCLLSLTFLSCSGPNRVEKLRYKRDILEFRQQKDNFLKLSPNSPLLTEQQLSFHSLRYFPVNIDYLVKAQFTKLTDPLIFKIQTSSGVDRVYVKSGRLDFVLNGEKFTLMTYQEKAQHDRGKKSLFVPFTDLTTGTLTYGGGRYLDIEAPVSNKVIVDFNRAYNPYCAYNHNFSCPIPPTENHIPVAVEVGEEMFNNK